MANTINQIYYNGDTIELEFQLFKNKSTNEYWVLTNHQIRFQLNYDVSIIKKATKNVTGGGDDQINITNAIEGIFIVIIGKNEAKNLKIGDYDYEIEVTTPTPNEKRYTVLRDKLRIIEDLIKWETIS